MWDTQISRLERDDTIKTDFSVVLFRSDFVLVSEKNHMKVHKNQWFLDRPYSPDHLPGAISRGHTRVPGGADACAVP